MKLTYLTLIDFRGFSRITLHFRPDNIVVIGGVNGSGKSTILESAAILLSAFVARLKSTSGFGRRIASEHIKQDSNACAILAVVEHDGKEYRWIMARGGKAPRQFAEDTDYADLKRLVDLFHARLAADNAANLPLVAYYPTNRAVLDIPLRIKGRHTFGQLDAYDSALSGGGIAFRRFFEWFREREDIENELRIDNPHLRDPQLEAIRSSIEQARPEYSDLRVRRSPLRMVVTKGTSELRINSLSDGEKCLIALIGDLARRLAIANPSTDNCLQGEGIVLIDEIELHLHPKWQREIIPALTRTFPNCQFVVTTHSPQVVGEVKTENLFYIEDFKPTKPEAAYGRDSNYILQTLMDVPDRSLKIKSDLRRLFDSIDRGDLEGAKQIRNDIDNNIGEDDPALVKADVILRRKGHRN